MWSVVPSRIFEVRASLLICDLCVSPFAARIVLESVSTRPVPLPASVGVQGRSSFFQPTMVTMARAKQFKTYEQQLALLERLKCQNVLF